MKSASFRDPAHNGALGAVTVTAAAEHDRKLAAAKFARSEKDAFNRIRSMRVIDDHPALAIVPDHFKAARDAHARRDSQSASIERPRARAHAATRRMLSTLNLPTRRIERLFSESAGTVSFIPFVADHLRRLHLGDGTSEAGTAVLFFTVISL